LVAGAEDFDNLGDGFGLSCEELVALNGESISGAAQRFGRGKWERLLPEAPPEQLKEGSSWCWLHIRSFGYKEVQIQV